VPTQFVRRVKRSTLPKAGRSAACMAAAVAACAAVGGVDTPPTMALDAVTSLDKPRALGAVALTRGTSGTSQPGGSVSWLLPTPR
jgi:hypothetical protein